MGNLPAPPKKKKEENVNRDRNRLHHTDVDFRLFELRRDRVSMLTGFSDGFAYSTHSLIEKLDWQTNKNAVLNLPPYTHTLAFGKRKANTKLFYNGAFFKRRSRRIPSD